MIEQDAGFLKEGVRVLSQALMEMEVDEHHVGVGRYERGPGRTGQRNGYLLFRTLHNIARRGKKSPYGVSGTPAALSTWFFSASLR
jgi:hypothetical protein